MPLSRLRKMFGAATRCADARRPSLLWCRSVRGLPLTCCPFPACDPYSACLLYAAHSHLAGPRGRLPTVSAQANCDCPSLAPVRNLVISSRAHHYCRQRFAPSAYPRARGRPCRQRGRLSTVLDHDIYTARVVVSELVGINVD